MLKLQGRTLTSGGREVCSLSNAMAVSSSAQSFTLRAIGPAVSCQWVMGMMPFPMVRPRVGLRPTMPQALDGLTMEPSVSVPMAAKQRLAETAAAEPELEPLGL